MTKTWQIFRNIRWQIFRPEAVLLPVSFFLSVLPRVHYMCIQGRCFENGRVLFSSDSYDFRRTRIADYHFRPFIYSFSIQLLYRSPVFVLCSLYKARCNYGLDLAIISNVYFSIVLTVPFQIIYSNVCESKFWKIFKAIHSQTKIHCTHPL